MNNTMKYLLRRYCTYLSPEDVKKELLIDDLEFNRLFKNAKKIPIRKVVSVLNKIGKEEKI